MAQQADACGNTVTAGGNFVRASLLAHSGQIDVPPGVAGKDGVAERAS
jgi:hypothetical protein